MPLGQSNSALKTQPGARYGILTVLHRAGVSERKYQLWECRCDCGTRVTVALSTLVRGVRWCCDCKVHGRRKPARAPTQRHKLTYSSWRSILNRVRSSELKHRRVYSSVSIADRWLDYNKFLEDMGERPGKNYSIDRINGNGNYEPGNCRWATTKEQNRNMHTNLYVEWDGKEILLCDLCELLGKPYSVVRGRLIALGWSLKDALEKPVREYKKARSTGAHDAP